MSKAFQTRARSHEYNYNNQFLQDFRVRARRNRLFGTWVANQLKLTQDEGEKYCSVLVTNFLNVSDENLLSYIFRDLEKNKVSFPWHQLQKQLKSCATQALTQMNHEKS